MEEGGEIKITVNASEIIGKLKSKIDRQNFCQEMNWLCPNEPGYDSNYFLKVIMGQKKYLPINFNIGYKLKYFKKGITLNKKYIISKMIGNPEYALYTPDNVNVEKLSRDFLLTLVAYIDPNLYKSFYSIYKEQMAERRYNKWINYTIDVKADIMAKVKQFAPTDINTSGNKSFKLSKNHIPNYTFKKADSLNINSNDNTHNNVIHINPKKKATKSVNSSDNKLLNLLSKEKRMQNNIDSKMGQLDCDIKIDDRDITMKDDAIK
jgi:hypothetical protein